MTSKLTRERLQEIAEDGFLKHGESKELARMALVAMDSEPVAWTWHYREQWHVTNDSRRAEFVAKDGDVAVLPLYRHAQPAPIVSFYRDGIKAARWVDQQREEYDSEHGWSDPDTGSFEFGNDAQREFSSTLEELAEGIRALHPNAGNSPVIPDGLIAAVNRLLDSDGSRGCYSAIRCHDAREEVERLLAAAPQEVKP